MRSSGPRRNGRHGHWLSKRTNQAAGGRHRLSAATCVRRGTPEFQHENEDTGTRVAAIRDSREMPAQIWWNSWEIRVTGARWRVSCATVPFRRSRCCRQTIREIYSWWRVRMLTLADARRIIAAAEKKAQEVGQPMNIAVVDGGGNLVAHARMDKAWIGSVDISIKKAWTSRAFDIATKDLAEHSQSGGQFFGIHASNNGRVMIFAGGIPLKRGDEVMGAIGVSGGSGQQDHAVAEAGAKAF